MQDTLAIDFGTTNTVMARAEANSAHLVTLAYRDETLDTIRTALSFQRSGRGVPLSDIGPWAIDMFLDNPENTRFLQSFKSFAASSAFSETQIFTRRLDFSHLLSGFLEKTMQRAGMKKTPKRLVVGRPVTFAGRNPDDALAVQRYEKALKAAGAEDIAYVHEPVAAAFFYAQRLTEPATVLVGDFGGGTSDFSVLRFSGDGHVEALGQSGVGIAGDTLDYRILDQVVAPHLGKGGTYKSWDKVLPIPAHFFASFSRWNELCLMNRHATLSQLQEFARSSPQGEQLEALIALIEGGESFGLYQAVARAKSALSQSDKVPFYFACHGIAIERVITRGEFDTWIAEDVSRMMSCARQLLQRLALKPEGIGRVFLTGGTSFVPAIRNAFAAAFGPEKLDTGDELTSIAKGLALIGASPDIDRWVVPA